MAKLVFGMNQSLDGYVDRMAFAPSPVLFRHFIAQARDQAGSVYGRCLYEVMRYWDDDHPEWSAEEREFATAWRSQPKWVVSRSLTSVGPNATLVEGDLEVVVRGLKAELAGEIDVGGPDLARSLGDLGLIDQYRIYLHPADCTDAPGPLWAGSGNGALLTMDKSADLKAWDESWWPMSHLIAQSADDQLHRERGRPLSEKAELSSW